MEIIVCILTTLFFAVMEIRAIKLRAAEMRHARIKDGEFMLLPLYSGERPVLDNPSDFI